MKRCLRFFFLFTLPTISALADAQESGPIPGYPEGIREIRYACPDGTQQPALYWAPPRAEGKSVPLLVALHTWSGDYLQAGGEVKYAEWCLQNGWAFVHPNFRGPNRTPEAMGSDLMIADIRASVAWAKAETFIDDSRIYAIGVSGGGHATQLLAGRTPEIWAGISSWCGISDIAAWHRETLGAGRGNYARQIEGALGGSPDASSKHEADARHRSPLHWLENAAKVPLDINHGIDDGRSGSVPFTHSLLAWNAVVPASERLAPEWIAKFYETRLVPPGDQALLHDALYGLRPPLFRKTHGNTRVTIFQGGHEIIHEAALNWLAAQRKGQPANWNPPKIGELKTTAAESESGK